MTEADLFVAAGEALYGERFVDPLASALGLQKRKARRMCAGRELIFAGVWTRLAELLGPVDDALARECRRQAEARPGRL